MYLSFFLLARSQNNKTNVFFAEILSHHDFFWACVCFISFCHPLVLSLIHPKKRLHLEDAFEHKKRRPRVKINQRRIHFEKVSDNSIVYITGEERKYSTYFHIGGGGSISFSKKK